MDSSVFGCTTILTSLLYQNCALMLNLNCDYVTMYLAINYFNNQNQFPSILNWNDYVRSLCLCVLIYLGLGGWLTHMMVLSIPWPDVRPAKLQQRTNLVSLRWRVGIESVSVRETHEWWMVREWSHRALCNRRNTLHYLIPLF